MADARADPDDGLVVDALVEPAHLQDAARLYREVFGYTDPSHGVNPRLLSALAANGGSVVGVLTPQGRVVAFAYGFAGADATGRTYHYSQAAVVSAELQGHGLGRRLKRAQARIALAHGARTMRWAYDPMIARNGHFNLDVLGARARWFHPDYYGPGTDRFVVEWDLTESTPVTAGLGHIDGEPPMVDPTGRRWGVPQPDGTGSWYLPVPARIAAVEATDPQAAAQARARVHGAVPELVDHGLVAVSCRRLDDLTSVYRFSPGGDR